MISIVIPNYNRTKDLLRAINSIFEQTYNNFEIIIVDDNSTIDIEKYIYQNIPKKKSNPIHIIKNSLNIGAAASRNKGVQFSDKKYIAFLDSDDYWEPTKLEKQIKKFHHNETLDLVYCDQFLSVDGDLRKSNKKMIKSSVLDELINGWTAPNTSTLMFKKASFLNIGGFDDKLKSCQDHDLWFRVAKEGFKIDFVNEPLSYFVLDSSDRISYNLENRMNGVNSFLHKAKKSYIPNEQYLFFKSKYICDVSLPIFIKAIKEKNFLRALKIYVQYLIFNRYFYKKVFEKVGFKL